MVFKVYDKINHVLRVVKKLDIQNVLNYHTLNEWLDIIESIRNMNSPYVSTIVDRM